ncbi:MAG: PD40 domain-containing protein, partial [Planctomycetaceae bacterium]|nr:PD40 domain-containing protein [Planctomycetaceae bacterium]
MWQFPQEMDIVQVDLAKADGKGGGTTRLLSNPDAYLAECVVRADGRYLVYCQHVVAEGRSGGDLLVRDLQDGRTVPVTVAKGYDGGPFFSPDGRRICYRSDRNGNDLLQIFVSELAFDHAGNLLGVAREFQLTDNAHVNWAPFWHPSGRYLVYATSELGHDNYEVFLIDADAGGDGRSTKYGTRRRRVTAAARF